ncbi:unnamed protein product [Larinioides sclopetarius]|uniref:Uncharacterized protein n=1 Tax=Larinioides sclopetarius TaxID=280406 RepID=A0AAV2BEA9_9ARAC
MVLMSVFRYFLGLSTESNASIESTVQTPPNQNIAKVVAKRETNERVCRKQSGKQTPNEAGVRQESENRGLATISLTPGPSGVPNSKVPTYLMAYFDQLNDQRIFNSSL